MATLLPLSDTCLSDTCPCKAGPGEPPTEEEPQINESKQPIIVRLPDLEHDSTVELDGYWNSSLGPTSVAVRGRIATFNGVVPGAKLHVSAAGAVSIDGWKLNAGRSSRSRLRWTMDISDSKPSKGVAKCTWEYESTLAEREAVMGVGGGEETGPGKRKRAKVRADIIGHARINM